MTQCRTERNRENPWVTLDKKILKDKRLSNGAKALFVICMSFPHDWKYNLAHLATVSTDGRDAIRAQINELVSFGYCERRQLRRKKGTFAEYEYVFLEDPKLKELVPQTAFPAPACPTSVNPTLLSNDSSPKGEEEEINKRKEGGAKAPPPPLFEGTETVRLSQEELLILEGTYQKERLATMIQFLDTQAIQNGHAYKRPFRMLQPHEWPNSKYEKLNPQAKKITEMAKPPSEEEVKKIAEKEKPNSDLASKVVENLNAKGFKDINIKGRSVVFTLPYGTETIEFKQHNFRIAFQQRLDSLNVFKYVSDIFKESK